MSKKFEVGEYVICPGHGLSKIAKIETKGHQGQIRKYFRLEAEMTGTKVLLSFEDAHLLRPCATIDECKEAVKIMCSRSTQSDEAWAKRFRLFLNKLSSGDILAIAEIVRDLKSRQREHKLSFGEIKMLETAIAVIKSELIVSLPVTEYNSLRIDSILKI